LGRSAIGHGLESASPAEGAIALQDDNFQRWQKILIDQLGYALNLVLTLSVAALAYWFQLLRDSDFKPSSTAKVWMIISFSGLALAAGSGLACVLTRLLDFRGTARRARNNPKAPMKGTLRLLGATTWTFFSGQLASFAVGIIALAVALLVTYGAKLR
jgi:hypothetical protein